jgi:hypothetical protein
MQRIRRRLIMFYRFSLPTAALVLALGMSACSNSTTENLTAQGTLTQDDIVHACVVMGSCRYSWLGANLNSCLDNVVAARLLGISDTYRQAQAAAQLEVGQCPYTLGEACTSEGDTFCNAGTLMRCVGGRWFGEECSIVGATCVEVEGVASCELPACTGAGTHCDGTRLVGCLEGREHSIECGPNGTCEETPNGPNCVLPSDSPSFCERDMCEGQEETLCLAGLRWTHTCSRSRADCSSSACEPESRCDGDVAIVKGVRIDCAEFGLGCSESEFDIKCE